MTNKPKSDEELRTKANEYVSDNGENELCLTERFRPGTPVGEHMYSNCYCDVAEAFEAGWQAARAAQGDQIDVTKISFAVACIEQAYEAFKELGKPDASWAKIMPKIESIRQAIESKGGTCE